MGLGEWVLEPDRDRWDADLASLRGHPLQSALWGEAQRQAERLVSRYLALREQGRTLALARVEERKAPILGTVAWIPRGPVAVDGIDCMPGLLRYLARERFILCAAAPGAPRIVEAGAPREGAAAMTIWVDLTVGRQRLLSNLDSQWRYGARRALREGVEIRQTTSAEDVTAFFGLCERISEAKGFRLPGNAGLIGALVAASDPSSQVQARLFAARFRDRLVAGALVLRVGPHVHYLWGGVDRADSKVRAGEAIQWAVIEWALEAGAIRYDLEGIDPIANRGTYEFKMKMGGRLVALPGQSMTALTWTGRAAECLIRAREYLR